MRNLGLVAVFGPGGAANPGPRRCLKLKAAGAESEHPRGVQGPVAEELTTGCRTDLKRLLRGS